MYLVKDEPKGANSTTSNDQVAQLDKRSIFANVVLASIPQHTENVAKDPSYRLEGKHMDLVSHLIQTQPNDQR